MFILLASLLPAIAVTATVIFSMQTWARLLPITFVDKLSDRLAFFIKTGLGALILSIVLFFFASFHSLSLFNLKFVFCLCACATLFEFVSFFARKKCVLSRWNWGVFIVGLYSIVILLLVLIPAAEKDELIYHLEIPRQMLVQGGWAWLPDNVYAFFPQFMELFFSFGLALSGEVAARLFHAAFGMLLAATLYVYARQSLNRLWAGIAVLIFMTVPSVLMMMSWAYVDLTFTWFALLAWIAAEKIHVAGDKAWRWAILAGAFCGATACIKYTGIQYTLILCALIFIRALFQKKGRSMVCPLVILILTTGIIFLPYLIRNFIYSGWPLYPFHFFGFDLKQGLNWDPERARLYFDWIKTFGAPIGSNGFFYGLFAPIRVFWDGEFNNPEKFDGVLGPLFLLLPCLYAFGKMKTASRAMALFCVFYIYYWALTTHQARFLIPILPLASLLLATGLSNLKRPLAAVILGLGIVFNLVVVSKEIIHKKPFQYWAGKESREAYLLREHRVYAMLAATNRLLPADAKVYLLQMKNYGYYLRVHWTADFIFERYQLEELLKQNPQPSQVEDFFKARRATHLLVDQRALRLPESGLEAKALGAFDQFLSIHGKVLAVKDDIVLYALDSSAS